MQARPFDIAWARSLQEQCAWAGVPVFIKQLGSNPTCGLWSESFKLNDRAGADPAEWPDDLRVQEFPSVNPDGIDKQSAHSDAGKKRDGGEG